MSSILICLAAGVVGSVFTAEAIPTWYATLVKPTINPPNSVFGPVWTVLYILMGISLFLVWSNKWKVRDELPGVRGERKAWNRWSERFWVGDWRKQNIILIFALQLALNVLWSYIFFGLHNPGLAFFEILALWFAVLYTIVNFYRISKLAAWLLVPYIVWLSFAIYLNYSIWVLNS